LISHRLRPKLEGTVLLFVCAPHASICLWACAGPVRRCNPPGPASGLISAPVENYVENSGRWCLLASFAPVFGKSYRTSGHRCALRNQVLAVERRIYRHIQ
jgi:hypothetical protein